MLTMLVIIPIVALVVWYLYFRREQTLHGDFARLGDPTGLSAEEIVAIVGPPQARSLLASGQQLAQWQAPGYHIAILFDANQRALKITHESVSA